MSKQSAYTWQSSGRTDIGSARTINEDAYLARPDIGLWVVADGMGGHAQGDMASSSIVETLAALPAPQSLSEFTEEVDNRPVHLNTRLRTLASRDNVQTIGSTVVVLACL